MENPIKMDDLGGNPTILGNPQMVVFSIVILVFVGGTLKSPKALTNRPEALASAKLTVRKGTSLLQASWCFLVVTWVKSVFFG